MNAAEVQQYLSLKKKIQTQRLLNLVQSGHPIRISVGSGDLGQPGWLATERDVLDLTQPEVWDCIFDRNSIETILAEHVWEHLTAADAVKAAKTCFDFLKPGGYLRVAVPDGNHPEENYINHVKPGGTGEMSDDHKTLYTAKSLSEIFETVGFEVELLEHHNAAGQFIARDWHPDDGMVWRSSRFDRRHRKGIEKYTSLILDARKPG